MIFTSSVLRSAAVAVLLVSGGALANPAAPGSMSLNPRDAVDHNPAGEAGKIALKTATRKMRRMDGDLSKIALKEVDSRARTRRMEDPTKIALKLAKLGDVQRREQDFTKITLKPVQQEAKMRRTEQDPTKIALKEVKQETNAQRMARGLPPKKPHFRRTADHTRNRRASPSSTPATASAQSAGACSPRSGVVHVTSPEAEGRPQLDGFLSMRANRFGQYGYTSNRDDALAVTVNDCAGTPFDITSSNGLEDFPFVGGIKGFSSDSPDLRSGSFNYVYIGGVTQTAPHATPQNAGNAFSAATGISEPSESAIWSFADGSTTVLEAHWVNSDGSMPSSTLVYAPSESAFLLTGDVDVVERAADERVSRATFTFES